MGVLLLKSLLYGILEGITEWLPVSSTGHLILLEEFLTLHVGADVHPQFASEFRELFLVAVQVGAVLAVIMTYRERLLPKLQQSGAFARAKGLWLRVIVGCIPAGLAGVAVDNVLLRLTGKDMDGLLYRPCVVGVMLILYGVLFIVAERMQQNRCAAVCEVEQIPYLRAFGVGIFQVLSLVPGTSRSGACILGGMLLGLSRTASAEFSFFMAVPVIFGACLVKVLGFAKFLLENRLRLPPEPIAVLLMACAVAYLTSCLSIRFLMRVTARRGFLPFGIYRILLGAVVLLYDLF